MHALEHRRLGVAELEQRLGAARHDARVAGRQRDAAGGPHAALPRHLGKAPVDVILEMTGGAVFEQSLDCLAPFGRMVAYGNASRQPMNLNVQRLYAQNQTVTGFFLSGFIAGQSRDRGAFAGKLLAELGGYVRDGRLRLQLGGTYKLAQAAEAHRAIEGRGTTGKIVLVP